MKTFLILFIGILSMNVNAQWQSTNGPTDGVNCLIVSDSSIYAGTAMGVYSTTNNGTTWTNISSGLPNAQVVSIAKINNRFFAGLASNQGIYTSVNNGVSWTSAGLANRNVRALITLGNYVFAGTENGGVFRTSDNGTNWTQVNSGLPTSNITSFAVSGSTLFAGTNSYGVYKSIDNGDNWAAANSGIADMNRINAIAEMDNKLFAGTQQQGSPFQIGNVYLSTDNGTNWTQVNSGTSFSTIYSLCVLGTNLIVGTHSGGLFLTSNNGASWVSISSNLPNSSVYGIVVKDSNLFVGTYGNGVWRRQLSEIITSVESNSSDLLSNFTLNQNYPNPFNPSTKISWQTPIGSHTTLKIYDVLGNEVATLVDEYKEAGNYEVEFNVGQAISLSSGVYFYKLQTGNFVQTRKMILMK